MKGTLHILLSKRSVINSVLINFKKVFNNKNTLQILKFDFQSNFDAVAVHIQSALIIDIF